MRVVFWQNILAFHQVAHITALAARPGLEVVWVVKEALSADRQAQGWKVPEVTGVQVVVDPDDAEITRLVQASPRDSVHVFSGIHQEPVARKAFYQCVKTSAQIGLLNETPFPGRLRDLISPVLHGGHRLVYGKRISFILAMGHMAVDFYKSVGYSEDVVFPYGYFPPIPTDLQAPLTPPGPVQILYLGQLIERKGVDILLRALGRLTDLDWALTLIGGGEQKEALEALSQELNLEKRVTFRPSQDNADAMRSVAHSDLFVLPSRHDGWGVVVNEALLRGVPVVCSDRCGASDLLGAPWQGETFPAGSAPGLEAVLRRRISRGRRTPEDAHRLIEWSRCIQGDAAARYLSQIIEFTRHAGPRPMPPWRGTSFAKIEAEGTKI